MTSQPNLPGSNNASTTGRAIDTYDRGFDGAYGTLDPVSASAEERRLAAQDLLTDTGYHQDGFVVDDDAELTDYSDSETDEVQPRSPSSDNSRIASKRNDGCRCSFWNNKCQKAFVHSHYETVTGKLPPWSWSRSKVRLALVDTHYSNEQLLLVADYAGLNGPGAGVDHIRQLIRLHFNLH
jgi:hypothetical protein